MSATNGNLTTDRDTFLFTIPDRPALISRRHQIDRLIADAAPRLRGMEPPRVHDVPGRLDGHLRRRRIGEQTVHLKKGRPGRDQADDVAVREGHPAGAQGIDSPDAPCYV